MSDETFPSAWIDDGYDENGFIAGVARVYPPVHFKFRPVNAEEHAQYTDEVKNLSELQVRRKTADWLSRKLRNWDIERPRRGGIVQFDAPNLLKLKPALFLRMFSIIFGHEQSDPDPKELHETSSETPAEKGPDGGDAKN